MVGEFTAGEAHDLAIWYRQRIDPQHCYRAFEAYGHAMAAASTFELLMALLVMKALALRLDKRANASIQPADQPGLITALRRGTFEKLQRRLTDSYTLSDELRAELKDAKSARDYLAHDFWQVHAGDLTCGEGVDLIATTAALSADYFRQLGDAVIRETGQDAHDFIDMLTSPAAYQDQLSGWRAFLDDELAK